MREVSGVTLTLTCDLDERAEWEIEMKGWFEHAIVNLPDCRSGKVCFWDPHRLAQDLETEVKSGKSCFAEPGLIVVPKVTVRNMQVAVEELYQSGFFDRLESFINELVLSITGSFAGGLVQSSVPNSLTEFFVDRGRTRSKVRRVNPKLIF